MTSRWLLVAGLWSFLLVGWLCAQPPGKGPPDKKGKGHTEEKVFEKYLKEAEKTFETLDQNGDGYLNEDEMPETLRTELLRWDNDRDGLIDQAEYRFYLHARLRLFLEGKLENTPETLRLEKLFKDWEKKEKKQQEESGSSVRITTDEDGRPIVFRAGKLPLGLPDWFQRLDTDRDGQVGLYEWRRGNLPLSDFAPFDRNRDGFLTAEEVLYRLRVQAGSSGSSLSMRSAEPAKGPLADKLKAKKKGKKE